MKNCDPGKEFVFKMPDGRVLGRAKNIDELANLVRTTPLEAVLYHAKGGHYAPWVGMLGLKNVAEQLKALHVNDKTIRVALLRILRE